MTRAEAEVRVARGAELLDEKWPGWSARISVDTLDMCEPCLCVLGQLYRDAEATSRRFAIRWVATQPEPMTLSEQHGFFVTSGLSQRSDYRALQDAWIAAIAARLSAPQQPEDDKERTA